MAARDCCATLLALFLPPVAVFMVRGCGCSLLINILLCLLCWIPGERVLCVYVYVLEKLQAHTHGAIPSLPPLLLVLRNNAAVFC